MMDRLELLCNVLCPVCGSQLLVSSARMVCKVPKGARDEGVYDKTYIVDCGMPSCADYRKIKFLKARYVECEFKWVD